METMTDLWPRALYMARHAPHGCEHLFAAGFFFQEGYGPVSEKLADCVIEALEAEKRSKKGNE